MHSSTPANWSKGTRSSAWISVPGYRVEFYTPDEQIVFRGLDKWEGKQLEVESDFARFHVTKNYGFNVSDDHGSPILHKEDQINTVTANIEGGDITSVQNLGSFILPKAIVSFGFSDTVKVALKVPNTDACWVTVTPNQSQWMGRLAPPKSPQAAKSFNTLVLPAPHDPGMNTMSTTYKFIEKYRRAFLLLALPSILGHAVVDTIISNAVDLTPEGISNIISGFAITQKDNTSAMLAIGARYFEYRPAYICDLFKQLPGDLPVPDKLYFHHWAFPGQAFDDFLAQVVKFLVNNPTEIVVIHVRGDGIPESCKKPSSNDVNQLVDTTIKQFGGSSVLRGNESDMSRPIDEIRQANKRLILLQEAKQYSNYDQDAMETLDGQIILDTFPNFISKAPSQLKEAIVAI